MRDSDAVQPPSPQDSDSRQPHEERDPDPCPFNPVNPWLLQFGSKKPRLGGLTVEQTTARQVIARYTETVWGRDPSRKADKA